MGCAETTVAFSTEVDIFFSSFFCEVDVRDLLWHVCDPRGRIDRDSTPLFKYLDAGWHFLALVPMTDGK